MPAQDLQEDEILTEGLKRLGTLLAPMWEIGPVNVGHPNPSNRPRSIAADAGADVVFQVRNQSMGRYAQLLVQAKRTVTPAQVKDQLEPQLRLMYQLTGDAAALVIAPWLSQRTRQHLEELDYGYLDLTGNVFLRLPSLGIVVKTEGAAQSDQPTRRPWRQGLRGDKAGALVRVLVDVMPPYRATELAATSGLSLAYVSRLLDALEAQNLLERSGRVITGVDWQGLIRERSVTYQLFKAHPALGMTATASIDAVLQRITELPHDVTRQLAVTGPVAAAAVAPLTVGGQLMIHVRELEENQRFLAKQLRLLPAKTGGEVLLLRTASPEVFENTRIVSGVAHVALSQLVLDGLGGSGRMPAEGEAIMEFMAADEAAWRLRQLDEWGPLPR